MGDWGRDSEGPVTSRFAKDGRDWGRDGMGPVISSFAESLFKRLALYVSSRVARAPRGYVSSCCIWPSAARAAGDIDGQRGIVVADLLFLQAR